MFSYLGRFAFSQNTLIAVNAQSPGNINGHGHGQSLKIQAPARPGATAEYLTIEETSWGWAVPSSAKLKLPSNLLPGDCFVIKQLFELALTMLLQWLIVTNNHENAFAGQGLGLSLKIAC